MVSEGRQGDREMVSKYQSSHGEGVEPHARAHAKVV